MNLFSEGRVSRIRYESTTRGTGTTYATTGFRHARHTNNAVDEAIFVVLAVEGVIVVIV